MALNIDELITKIEDLFDHDPPIFTDPERDLIIDALILYKEMN